MFTTINAECDRAEQSKHIKIGLKPHQLAMIHQMSSLEMNSISDDSYIINSNIGILADPVGSGKTLTTLGLIASSNDLPDVEPVSVNINNRITILKKENKSVFLPLNIIVVPHTIISQWVQTIENYTDLKYLLVNKTKVITSLKKKHDEIETQPLNVTMGLNNYKVFKVFEDYNIILVSSSFYNKLANILFNYYNNIMINRIFIDEVDTINIRACHYANAKFSWFITSTYENMLYPKGVSKYIEPVTNQIISHPVPWNERQNYQRIFYPGICNTGYIRDCGDTFNSILNDFPTLLTNLILKNDEEFIKQSFRLEDPNDNYLVCQYPLNMNIIKDVVNNDVLQLLNAGNVSGAIERLNCSKVDSDENLIKLVTQDLEYELHNTKLELDMKRQLHYQNIETKQQAISKLEEKIASITSKITYIRDKLVEKAKCPVCCDQVENKTIVKCCNTAFCLECITTWLAMNTNNGCPYCRGKVSLHDTIIVDSSVKTCAYKSAEIKDKIYHLKNHLMKLKAKGNYKLLIFADYFQSFEMIKSVLGKLDIRYAMLKGSSAVINNTVESYKTEDGIDVLLLNSDYCGSGLNLENTTDIVVFHYMNRSKDKQIIGRAQRPGRTSKLNILRLCYENEIASVSDMSTRVD